MKFDFPQKDLELICAEIKKNLGSTRSPKLYIYGSRVKGTARKFSDIDLLLQAQSYDGESLSRIDFSELDTVYKIDFVLDSELYDPYRNEIYGHMIQVF